MLIAGSDLLTFFGQTEHDGNLIEVAGVALVTTNATTNVDTQTKTLAEVVCPNNQLVEVENG